MKRLLGLILALTVLLPVCQTLVSAPLQVSAIQHSSVETISPAADRTQCPLDTPTKQHCAPTADPQPLITQLAPRPDSSGAFGAMPATLFEHSRATAAQQSRAPDLHALSISRI
ncbi:hypothetical protein ACIGB6_17715 [Paeniglutamicibacter gangotriensis]|uniref:Uncharacterized protein n=1 Tax=Paeniglutamicibacter gangotriensis TaxID=254787 RepID=A0A5B0EJ26_9MICC|nr:hypothetical protein [Paeniglutamicibacter gangotriensis]KAA0978913.1 hypothetical protein FQ154_03935 [Paeniglutamicibacter gangotriensis]